MLYEYQCERCNIAYESPAFARIGQDLPDHPCRCGGVLIRMASLFNCTPVVDPYFNHSVGQVVTSNRDFEEKLRIGSLEASESTGIPHSFTPVYPAEAKASAISHAPDTNQSDRTFHKITDKRSLFT